MYHSITIGTDILGNAGNGEVGISKNTWSNWHLIPATRPLVNPPSPNIKRIAIPGGDGSIDLTDVVAGRATFGDRTGSWDFYVDNDYMPWSALYSEIMRYLHGKECQCVLEDDPQYYYEGRLSVNEWRSDPNYSRIVINYQLGPYKKFRHTGENWIWDTFSFGDPTVISDLGDKITSYKNIRVDANSTTDVDIVGEYNNATISVYTDMNECQVKYKGIWYNLSRGVYTPIDSIRLENGTNTITLKFTSPIIRQYDNATGRYIEKVRYTRAIFSITITGGML